MNDIPVDLLAAHFDTLEPAYAPLDEDRAAFHIIGFALYGVTVEGRHYDVPTEVCAEMLNRRRDADRSLRVVKG